MNTIRIYGASDDLVEIEGDIEGCDEYGFFQVGKTGYIAASDGTILTIAYAADDTGCWRVAVERQGTADFKLLQKGDDEDDSARFSRDYPPYSDVAELTGNLEWVKFCRKNHSLALTAIGQPASESK